MRTVFFQKSLWGLMLLFLMLNVRTIHAQRYLSERKPDLALTAATAKWAGSNQLNISFSLRNAGDAVAKNLEESVILVFETSGKANTSGVTHTWKELKREPLTIGKKELVAGENFSGNITVPCTVADAASLRVSLYIEQDNYESGAAALNNNAFVASVKK